MKKDLTITVVVKANKVYRFCGNGIGIPGMPHEITREQAERDGILEQLDAAIAAGVYQAKE